MPRANRYFLGGYVWHITHRCHKQEFLLKFLRDRKRWVWWLFRARQRYRLCVLDYMVTSNHVHLLVCDQGRGEIARSMQLVAGRVAQAYNRRKRRKGAFWEDRYHATAVATDEHLIRCLVYIDLNMVRAGAVAHPTEWASCGYREIQNPPQRRAIVDLQALMDLVGIPDHDRLRRAHADWVTAGLRAQSRAREHVWTQSVAVGDREFVDEVRVRLGVRARYRGTAVIGQSLALREPVGAYEACFDPETDVLSSDNRPLRE